ncbi:hypothetical protein BDY19DRAFT_906982 [Irpex rosettiformis]|uniref:Uncharacterized protein n=1 Tax=Irpex rosettiformis TaxID=378272 RepID=A0ACB8U181_9APHY|nr:hypothetical protein BDY19DRAFT_906982 [Irpex rosettiformis]
MKQVLNCNRELGFWGPWITERTLSLAEADNGATLLDVHGGHFLACFIEAMGESFASVSAVMETRFPDYQVTPASGEPPKSDETFKRTCEDNIAISGTLKSGAVASLHFRSGLSTTKPGRTPFLWLIDGTEGTIKAEDDDLQLEKPSEIY